MPAQRLRSCVYTHSGSIAGGVTAATRNTLEQEDGRGKSAEVPKLLLVILLALLCLYNPAEYHRISRKGNLFGN